MDKRKKSKMPCLFGGNEESPKRKTIQPRSSTDGITEQNLFKYEVGQGSSKQGYTYGTPMKTLLAKEMLNEASNKKRSPSIIAKLMGLDGLPSPQPVHKQPKKLSNKITMEQQHFKDVYEDPEASHLANSRRSTKREFGYIKERCDEMLRESNAIKSKLERVDSNSDLMLSFLQKPGSLFVKHLHDQQRIHSHSLCNQITVLKPSNSRHGVHGKSLKEERETLNSHRSSRVQFDRNEVSVISPTKIVVLKPNLAKNYKNKNTLHSPDEFRKNKECREAREIARQITSRIKEDFEGGVVNLFDSSEPEVTMVPSRNSFDWYKYDRPKHSPYNNMSESSVIKEAKKRMSQRWKTHGYKDSATVSNGKANTLEEMLSVPNNEMGHGEYLRTTSRSRTRTRSRSLSPSFCNQKHRMCECDHHEAHNDPLNGTKSKGMKGNYSHKEELPCKSSRYNRRYRSSQHSNACSLEFESHSSRKPIETCFENEVPSEQRPLIYNIHGAATNAASVIDVIKISSESSNELSSGTAACRLEDADSFVVDEDSSNSQEPWTAKSGGTSSVQLSGPEPESSEGSKEVEFDEYGEISVLEVPPIEDASSGSDCFEGVNSRLHELRKQLHLLKMESESAYDDANYEQFETLSNPDTWESSYLTDILNASGFYNTDPFTFITTFSSIDSPINPSLFDNLEKKHSQQTTITRPERRLFYDRIHEVFFNISKTMVSCLWVKNGVQMKLTEIGFEEEVGRLLAKQEMEASEEFEEILIDKGRDWFLAAEEMDILGKKIAEMLVNDLVLEIMNV